MKSDKLKPPPQFKTVAQRITQLSDPIYMGETAQAAAVFDEYLDSAKFS